MKEILGVIWVCSECGKLFIGPLDNKEGILPCGHVYSNAAYFEEIALSLKITSVVQNHFYAPAWDPNSMTAKLEALLHD
jgi:hypothetical protein